MVENVSDAPISVRLCSKCLPNASQAESPSWGVSSPSPSELLKGPLESDSDISDGLLLVLSSSSDSASGARNDFAK